MEKQQQHPIVGTWKNLRLSKLPKDTLVVHLQETKYRIIAIWKNPINNRRGVYGQASYGEAIEYNRPAKYLLGLTKAFDRARLTDVAI
ncbi:hypothetical protein GWI33_019509 [Rhynchophorus ferrugineus]|uniref:Uncharacterized protein n=1 Tax=Rhynchophorus ferrugineus TaxID=354439 RepID=A0A834HTN9_RHYFE|nr:hypothetical protein GWI33_019509 [Rhynchophorus ferrugineus]